VILRSFIIISLLTVFSTSHGFAQELVHSDTLKQVQADTQFVQHSRVDVTEAIQASKKDTAKKAIKITPWKYSKPLGMTEVSNDSLLRWQMWPNWVYRMNRKSGVISYRLGTLGRTDGLLIEGHEPRHQSLSMGNINLTDPVTGSVNWNYIPHHKVAEYYDRDFGIQHESNFRLRQYYLNKPESQLKYDESSYQYRSLEFMVTENFSRKTNAELSYWDRRDGQEYPNSTLSGRQIFARLFHNLSNETAIKATYLQNAYDLGMPFGYRIGSLLTYNFDRYAATANQSSAQSKVRANVLSLGLYKRKKGKKYDNFQVGLTYRKNKRTLRYNVDTTAYNVGELSGYVHKWFDLSWLKLEGKGTASKFFNTGGSQSSLSNGGWGLLNGEGALTFEPFDRLKLNVDGSVGYRSDSYTSESLSSQLKLRVLPFLLIKANAAFGTQMPTPQQLNWQSRKYSGTSGLSGETIASAGGSAELDITSHIKLGVRGRAENIQNGIMMNAAVDSVFTNMRSPYQSLMGIGYASIYTDHLELNGSATWHKYTSTGSSELIQELKAGPARIWFKGSAYLKGYVLSRAAYVKGGVAGMYSPNGYRASQYLPSMDIWQTANTTRAIPPFYRLDVDISARVRTIMILLRWENVLDGINQLGYFETDPYPMPGRRFMFGIRAFFRN